MTRSNVITPTPQTTDPTAPSEDVDVPSSDVDRSTNASMPANDNPPALAATETETGSVPAHPKVIKIKVIGPRPPPGYIGSDSEGDVERLVLPSTEIA